MRLRPGLRAKPRSPDPVAGFKAGGREGEGREEKGKGEDGQRGKGREGERRLTLMRSWNRAADWLRQALTEQINRRHRTNFKHSQIHKKTYILLWDCITTKPAVRITSG